ncbi:MAG TPA: dienelactone hydrolase family protein, partial [Niabella sp.]|nr:dienelactone hydrolase family protein [Niabella sp.]
IKKGAAPAIIFLGTKDQLIPVQQVKDYQERMKEAGSRCEVYLYEGQQHGFFNYKKEGSSYYDATLKEATVFLRSLGYIP